MVALFLCAFIIYNTYQVAVLERQHDLALLRMIGAPGAFEIISGEDGYVKIGGTLAVVVGLAGTTIEDNVNVLPKGTDVSASPL